ncbi:MAG: SMI1/KNR4 family protein [Bryobacterales bacterium]|nr:SMI1/KNR4 family protein [Bryobacterales bacterium]
MDLDTLIRCWRQTPGEQQFRPAATAAELALAEEKLSLTLPPALRQLYTFSNGLSLFQGHLTFYPLHEEKSEICLTRVTPWLREQNWLVPAEILIAGSTGTGDPIGVWIGPKSAGLSLPVVQIDQSFQPNCFSLASTGLIPYLTFETALDLAMSERGGELHTVLGAPVSLPAYDIDSDDAIDAWAEWIDPQLLQLPAATDLTQLDENTLRRLLQ